MKRSVALMTLLLITAPAQASEWGSYADWQVTGNESDNTCFFGREFEGPGETHMGVSVDAKDSSVSIWVLNDNWSLKEGDGIKVALDLRGTPNSYSGSGMPFTSGGKSGFGMNFKSMEVLSDVAAANGAHFYKIDGEGESEKYTLIDKLNLDGTGAAVAALRRCFAHQKGLIAAAEREKKRWKDIPADPFKADRKD